MREETEDALDVTALDVYGLSEIAGPGDTTSLRYEECECGRTTVRMDNVTGRTGDLLITRGVNVYPHRSRWRWSTWTRLRPTTASTCAARGTWTGWRSPPGATSPTTAPTVRIVHPPTE